MSDSRWRNGESLANVVCVQVSEALKRHDQGYARRRSGEGGEERGGEEVGIEGLRVLRQERRERECSAAQAAAPT
jgi:hypothetical protein